MKFNEMKLSLREIFYVIFLLFVIISLKISSRPYYWYAIGIIMVLALVIADRKYSPQKSYLLYLGLGLIGAIIFPKIILLAAIWIIPGLIFSTLLGKKFDSKDKFIFGLLFGILLLLAGVLLSYLGLPVNRFVLGAIFALPVLLLLKKNFRTNFVGIFRNEPDYKMLASMFLLLTITALVFSPFFNESKLPQTTAVEYYSSGEYVYQSIIEHQSFPTWEIKNTLGQARYTLDTPLYFWMSGASGALFEKGLIFIYNPLFLFLMFFLAIVLYLCLLKLTHKNYLGISGAALFITAEPIGRALGASGNMKAFAAFALTMVPFYFFTRFKETKDYSFFLLIILGAAVSLLAHIAPIHLLIALCLTSGILLFIFFKEAKPKESPEIIPGEIKPDRRKHLAPLLSGLAFIIIFISFWALPFVKYMYNAISEVDAQLKISLADYVKDNVTLTVAFVISILGLAYFFSARRSQKESEKENSATKSYLVEEWSSVALGIIPLLFIIPYVWECPSLKGLFTLFKIVEFHKTEVIFFLAVTLLLVLFLKNLLNHPNKKFHNLGIALTALCFIFAAISGYQLHQTFNTYVSEEIHAGQLFTNEFNVVKGLPPGNVFTAGVFGLAIDGIFYDFTGHPTLGIGFAGAQESYTQYRIRMDDGYTIYNHTRDYITNIFKLNGIKYLFINRCNPGVNLLMQELFSESYLKNIPDQQYKMAYAPQNNCILILELENSTFARKIKMAQLDFKDPALLDTECIRVTHGRCLKTPKYDQQLYNRPDGYNIIWSSGEGDYVLSNISQDLPTQAEGGISYSRTSDTEIKLSGKMDNEWIYVAESYFPRWKAYDERGKELEIRKTNLDTMAIKVQEPTSSIKVIYAFPWWEKVLYGLALMALVFLIIIFSVNPLKLKEKISSDISQ